MCARVEDTDIESLFKLAKEAKQKSHSPYSNFPVGAAVMTEDKSIYTGCNVENFCFPVGVCAEITATVKAVSDGHRKIVACAVIANTEDIITPCGLCRQTLREFGKDMVIYCGRKDGSYRTFTLEELMPVSFGPD